LELKLYGSNEYLTNNNTSAKSIGTTREDAGKIAKNKKEC
jgi:hypothetical protein